MSRPLGILAYQGELIRKLQLENRRLEIENMRLREDLAVYFTENKRLKAKVRRNKRKNIVVI